MEEDGDKLGSTGNGSIDRISTLSPDIIHSHIFTRLDDKDIKMMSCLSNTWYSLSNSFPYLDFNHSSLGKQMFKVTAKKEDIDNFVSHVRQTLRRFYNPNRNNNDSNNQIIRNLTIPFKFQLETAEVTEHLDNWINLVLQHGVDEFNLYITNPPLPDSYRHHSMTWYELPPIFFSHPNSITKVARLEGCSLLRSFLTSNPNPHPNFLLKKLRLRQVLMDDTVLRSIISCCPLIEDLDISHCIGIVNCLRISHLHKLKCLQISDQDGDFEIDSPSLQRLLFIGSFKVRIIRDCPLLTDLELWSTQVLDLQDLVSRLPLIRTLCLVDVDCLTKLMVLSHTLRELQVIHCRNLAQLKIDDAPSLVSVEFGSCSSPHPDLLVSSSASAKYNVTLSSYTSRTIEEFLFQLNSFVSKMEKFKLEVLKIYLPKYVENISLEELKRVVQPPVDRVHDLKVFFFVEMKENHILVLDGLLLTCRPHSLSIPFRMNKHSNYIVENILEQIMMGHRDGYRTLKSAKKCWLHHIKDVMYLTKDGTETKLIIDATSEISNIFSYIQSKNSTLLTSTPYPEIKLIFKW